MVQNTFLNMAEDPLVPAEFRRTMSCPSTPLNSTSLAGLRGSLFPSPHKTRVDGEDDVSSAASTSDVGGSWCDALPSARSRDHGRFGPSGLPGGGGTSGPSREDSSTTSPPSGSAQPEEEPTPTTPGQQEWSMFSDAEPVVKIVALGGGRDVFVLDQKMIVVLDGDDDVSTETSRTQTSVCVVLTHQFKWGLRPPLDHVSGVEMKERREQLQQAGEMTVAGASSSALRTGHDDAKRTMVEMARRTAQQEEDQQKRAAQQEEDKRKQAFLLAKRRLDEPRRVGLWKNLATAGLAAIAEKEEEERAISRKEAVATAETRQQQRRQERQEQEDLQDANKNREAAKKLRTKIRKMLPSPVVGSIDLARALSDLLHRIALAREHQANEMQEAIGAVHVIEVDGVSVTDALNTLREAQKQAQGVIDEAVAVADHDGTTSTKIDRSPCELRKLMQSRYDIANRALDQLSVAVKTCQEMKPGLIAIVEREELDVKERMKRAELEAARDSAENLRRSQHQQQAANVPTDKSIKKGKAKAAPPTKQNVDLPKPPVPIVQQNSSVPVKRKNKSGDKSKRQTNDDDFGLLNSLAKLVELEGAMQKSLEPLGQIPELQFFKGLSDAAGEHHHHANPHIQTLRKLLTSPLQGRPVPQDVANNPQCLQRLHQFTRIQKVVAAFLFDVFLLATFLEDGTVASDAVAAPAASGDTRGKLPLFAEAWETNAQLKNETTKQLTAHFVRWLTVVLNDALTADFKFDVWQGKQKDEFALAVVEVVSALTDYKKICDRKTPPDELDYLRDLAKTLANSVSSVNVSQEVAGDIDRFHHQIGRNSDITELSPDLEGAPRRSVLTLMAEFFSLASLYKLVPNVGMEPLGKRKKMGAPVSPGAIAAQKVWTDIFQVYLLFHDAALHFDARMRFFGYV